MVYYICAMRFEAEPFIKRLDLKKNTFYKRIEVFENDRCAVLVTGAGFLKAAMAVTELLTTRDISTKDLIINVGICGYMGENNFAKGTAFICNSIKSGYDGRTYYPDMIYKSPFRECSLVTYSSVVSGSAQRKDCMVDMEAAGVYEASIRFVKINHIAFIKIVSDYCDGQYPLKEEAKEYVDRNADMIIRWAQEVLEDLDSDAEVKLTEEEIEALDRTAQRLHYSVTRRNQLKKQMVYEKVMGRDVLGILEGERERSIYGGN